MIVSDHAGRLRFSVSLLLVFLWRLRHMEHVEALAVDFVGFEDDGEGRRVQQLHLTGGPAGSRRARR